MAPLPQEQPAAAPVLDGHRVVISGMSGLYPDSNHVKDLQRILYDRENPITAENPRWTMEHPELPKQLGQIPELRTFDAQFFRVHYRLSNNMDPMSRKLLEQSYQAIYDAGMSPEHLAGQKVGVFIGSCFSETEKACFYVAHSLNGFGIAGCSKAMFANRISYWLNAKGPSMNIDAACSSSIVALERAYEAINKGECDAAIVGGANICLHPQSSVHFGRTMALCMDGKTKCFDKNADGVARSEAISVLFLQKAKYAYRIYADVCYVKSKYDPMFDVKQKQIFGPEREAHKLTSFFKDFYDQAGIPPSMVEYVEAYGSASPQADKSELEAIEEVFCKGRTPSDPLLVGSVMSNIGYAEAASGLSAITKVVLGYHTGQLAGNLHFTSPREDVAALRDGRIKVVAEHQPIRRSFSAVNSLSLTGLNAHVLLHGHYKPKDLSRYQSAIPHLVPVSARQESSVKNILDDLESRPVDPEEIALLHNIHELNTIGHLGRGYTILGKDEEGKTVSLAKKADYFNDAKRPLWFVYSGMGSQWAGMATHLMRIPIFAAAIERCRKALEPKGLDIVSIITSPEKSTFDNILHSFVGIAAVQIGLTDVLRAVGIKPDMIIGHSVGELGCAYADGCFTAEEMILAAYYRGLVSVQTPFIKGSMAAVGIGYQQVKSMCPPEVEVACHNGQDSSTISGPADIMKDFVAQLTAKGIFAKEVPCSNIAYHSRYIKEAGPGLLKHLSDLIKNPKPRSERWLSTSVPQEKWENESAKFSSAEYHTNNLLSPVLFEETSRLVPANAVLIEIAPHGLLQAILKRSLSSACVNIPLTRRGHADNAMFVLEALGQLYMQGFNLTIKNLYPTIDFPVSTGTPMLSHMVEWAHNEKWNVPLYMPPTKTKAAAYKNIISVYDSDHEYLMGHVIKNEMRYPFAAAIVAVWDTLAMTNAHKRQGVSVQFRDVYFHNQPKLTYEKLLRIGVQIQKGSGYFEVMDETSKILSGYVTEDMEKALTFDDEASVTELDEITLSSKDIYKTFYDRQSHYRGGFRSILSANASLTNAKVSWTGNWVTFIDSLIQFNTLRERQDNLIKPKHLHHLVIKVEDHENVTKIPTEDNLEESILESIEVNVNKEFNMTRCGGVIMQDIKFVDAQEKDLKLLSLKGLEFVPYFQLNNNEAPDALNIFLQMVNENLNKDVINVLEILSFENSFSLEREMMTLLNEFDNFKINFEQINVNKIDVSHISKLKKADLIMTQQMSTSNNMCELLFKTARQDIFVLTLDKANAGTLPSALCRVVASTATPRGRLVLARWRPTVTRGSAAAVTVSDVSDFAILRSTKQKLGPDQSLLILSKYPPVEGLKELVEAWQKEPTPNKINVALINPKNFKDLNMDQLSNFDLTFNVYKNGAWGGEYFVKNKYNFAIENPVSLRSKLIGDLGSLYWEEIPCPGPDDIAVAVHYAGLNFRDANKAFGNAPLLPDEELGYGIDFSGVTKSNERVMGLVRGGAASTVVKTSPSMLWPIPSHWTMEDAATVPLPYAHAFYLLGIKTYLTSGSTIMVHGATGGLGQALISIALAHKCIVFATVSDVKKKRFLRKLFPELPEDHIGNSRDVTFCDMVLSATNGAGCNIVITCLHSDLKNVAFHCSSPSGITLDTHQITSKENFAYGMFHMTNDRTYVQADFSSVFKPENASEMKKIQVMLSEGIARGYVKPLSRVCYKWGDAARALRLLAASRHRGRALLDLRAADPLTQPRLGVSPAASHIVVDAVGESALATKLVSKLVARGAKNIVLHTTDSAIDGYVHMKIKSWENDGVQVKLSSENLNKIVKLEELIKITQKMGPVESVFIVCSEFVQQNDTATIINLFDVATRNHCPKLKYFVVLSENGNIGQETCLGRANDELPATLLMVPYVEKYIENPEDVKNGRGAEKMTTTDVLNALEQALRIPVPVVAVTARSPPAATLLQNVSNIAGLTITDTLQNDETLGQIVPNNERLEAIAVYLAQNTNLTLSKDEAAALTIGRLIEMERHKVVKEYKEDKGIGLYFSHVDPDELTATTEIVPLHTLTHQPDRDEGLDNNETYIVMIPGLDGHYRKLEQLAERLKLHAFVLQAGCDDNQETVEEIALRFAKTIMKYLNMKDTFYLMGYSFGALVALEIASVLEKHGYKGVVFCVDAEPDTFKTVLESNLGCSGAQLQDSIIQHMYSLMVGENSTELEQMLKKTTTWQEKIDVSVRALRGRVPHSTDYAALMIETAYGRIQQALKYDGKQLKENPISSQIVYLRSTSTAPGEKVGLARYSKQPIKVYDLAMDHARALEDLRCANIINTHLNTDVLETFNNRNLCDSNFLNVTRFYTKDD